MDQYAINEHTTRGTEVLLMRWLRPRHLVLLNTGITLLAFLCSYTVSVSLDLVAPLFPSISQTGAEPPASCIFSLLLNAGAVFGVLCVYMRHRHVEQHTHTLTSRASDDVTIIPHVLNDISMCVGCTSWFGVMVVAAFQSTHALLPHYLGAVVAFTCGNLYAWLQTYFTFRLAGGLVPMVWVRGTLAAVSSVCLSLVFLFVALAMRFEGGVVDPLHWKPWEPGYKFHLVTDFSEWTMAVCDLLAFLTLYVEFKLLDTTVQVSRKEPDTGVKNVPKESLSVGGKHGESAT